MSLTVTGVECPELFTGPPDAPDQVVRVTVTGPPGPVTVSVAVSRAPARPPVSTELDGEPVVVEVPVALPSETQAGASVPATVTVTGPDSSAYADVLVPAAEPGWTVHMVSHFHYDPVWWATQAAYTSAWDDLPGAASARQAFQLAGFDLVRAHLETARHDPDYRFVLAETDYLKPWWDTVPASRDLLRRLIAGGRCELVGGTYNEPNTNLTSVESTVRNLAYGIGLQRDVLGGSPETAWQLDAFGHDPQFPGLCAGAGLTGSSWARGPFHQWGPLGDPARDALVMQFPSEFEWVAPSGAGLLTAYMPGHYSAGWSMDSAPTLAAAEQAVYDLFLALKPVAATRHVLLPVGTDYSPPNKWVTAIARDWAARYTWPRFVCAVPRDFLAAVRASLAASGLAPVPVSRDMNPIYTGKDVSYIDTKQAQRQAEVRLAAGETFATLAGLRGAPYPAATVDGAWRRLLYGAHHDGITGSEGDQVYLDLLAGWRAAWSAGGDVRDVALDRLLSSVDTRGPGRPVTVVNALAWARTDLVRVAVPAGSWSVVTDAGDPVPAVLDDGTLSYVARDVPATGWRTYRLVPGPSHSWSTVDGATVANGRYRVTADPARGGTVSSLVDLALDRELVAPGRVGNELLLYAEYPQHPRFGEGPWHLLPTGPPRAGSASSVASVRAEVSPAGSRLTVRGRVQDVRFEQTLAVWNGLSRVDCETRLDPVGEDRLLRLRWPSSVRGGLPVSEVGAAVVGRGWGIVDVDSAEHPWTLDNPAHSWFGVGSTARVRAGSSAVPVGVAEVVAPADLVASPAVRDLVVALVRAGVTSTTSVDSGSRYGWLAVDSNLPDTRIAVGGPDSNAFTAAVLADAPPAYAEELGRQLAATGRARVWVPAARPLAEVWVPDADLRGPRDLPVLVVAGPGAVAELVDDLADAEVTAGPPLDVPGLDDVSVAVLSRGLPGFAVDRTGALHLSLVRACTGWPSGVWIDKPRRSTPDGSGFQLQHWTHTFEYALASGAGDWRSAGFVPAGQGFTAPLHAVVGAAHPGPLPGVCSLLSVDPPGAAVVTAVKPIGTPLASGRAPAPPAAGIAVRLYEAAGRSADVTVRLAGGVASAARADLLDAETGALPVAADGSVTLSLRPAEVTTVLLRPLSAVDGGVTGPAAGVVPSRYWLENAGPAPDGNLPVTVHAGPARSDGSGPVRLTVTAASSLGEVDWTGVVAVEAGPGWTVEPAAWPVVLPAGGWAETTVTVTPARDAPPGDHPVTVSLSHAGQVVRDLVVVSVPGPVGAQPGGLEVELDTLAVAVRPGRRERVRVLVTNRYRGPVDATLQLLGPVDTWPLVPEWTVPLRLSADERRTVTLGVVAPADAAAGSWWLLARLGGAGQVAYSDSIRLTVDR
ncbi:MAG TPA: glycoside hydrolase family 38 C-terminal domain-containing protein [Mycobacteriales bacterium]